MCQPLFLGNSEIEILVNLERVNLKMLDFFGRHIPSDIRRILERALAHDPSQRFQSAEDMRIALDRAALGHGVSLGAHVLAEWLTDLGLLSIASDVRDRPAQRLELSTASAPGRAVIAETAREPLPTIPEVSYIRTSEHPFSEAVTLAATELDTDAPRDPRWGEPVAAGESLADAVAHAIPAVELRYSIPDELAHAVSTRTPELLPPASLQHGREVSDIEYCVRRTGGAVLGPLALSRLLELVATGRVGSETEVSRDGGPFMALASLFELSRLASRPAYRFHEPFGFRAKDRAPIRLDTLPRALFSLARGRHTGLLCARRGADQLRIYFVNGAPVFTASSDPGDLLGSQLVAAGVVDRGRLELALEHGWRRGLRSGDALVDAGLVRPAALHRALVDQRRARLVALLRLRAGEVAWIEGGECGEEPVPTGAPLKLIAASVLDAYSDDDVARVLEQVALGGLLQSADGGAEISRDLALGAAETEALSRARQGRSLSTLIHEGARVAGFSREAAYRAVFIGLCGGALVHKG
jgi:hypothetical protein